jgi:hypothetical protein
VSSWAEREREKREHLKVLLPLREQAVDFVLEKVQEGQKASARARLPVLRAALPSTENELTGPSKGPLASAPPPPANNNKKKTMSGMERKRQRTNRKCRKRRIAGGRPTAAAQGRWPDRLMKSMNGTSHMQMVKYEMVFNHTHIHTDKKRKKGKKKG